MSSNAFQGGPAPASDKLIIGIGNEFRGDDGVGLFVARRLYGTSPAGTTILESSGEGTELMTLWTGADLAIVIDAVHSGAVSGKVHRFEIPGDAIPKAIFPRHSTHAFGLVEAIELSETLGSLPRRLIVYGIEGRTFETGASINGEVLSSALKVADKIIEDISA